MKTATTRKTALHVRPLEARDVPSTLSGGILAIDGTGYDDTVTVRYRSDVEVVEVTTHSRIPTGFGPMRPPVLRVEHFAAPEVRDIYFRGQGGNDVFDNQFVLPSTGVVVGDGGAGNDRLTSVAPFASEGRTAITFVGGTGNDVLSAGAAGALMMGGDGNDSLYGGSGRDMLYGENGADLLRGRDGADLMYGDAGVDALWGGNGDDSMQGGLGDDALFGENGNDLVVGDNPGMPAVGGNDWLDGGAGNDNLWGMAGADLMYGGTGTDTVDGGAGADRVDGGIDADRDLLVLGLGMDVLIVHRFGSPTMFAEFPDDIGDFTRGQDRVSYRYNGGWAMP